MGAQQVYRKLFTDTAVYGMGSIVPRVFNFFLVPLHTRAFGPEAYGRITDTYGWIAILNVIFLFGMETAYLRFSTKKDGDEQKTFQTAQTVIFLMSLMMTVMLYSAFNLDLLMVREENRSMFLYASATLLIDSWCAMPFVRLRLKNETKKFALLKISNVVLLVVLNIWFLRNGNAKPDQVFLANMIANLGFLIYFLPVLMSWRPQWNNQLAGPMLTYSFPVMLTGLAGMTNEMFSRISIDNWLPQDFYSDKSPGFIQGIFGACYKFAILMTLVVQAFRMAAEPFFFSRAEQKDSPQVFAQVNHYFIVAGTFFMMAICFNLNWLKYLVDEQYWSGLGIVPWLLLGYLFLGVYYNLTVWFKVTDKTFYGTLFAVVGAVFTVFMNYLLIPVYGIMGSAAVTFLSYFLMTVICYFFGQRYYPIPYKVGRDLTIIFFGFVAVLFFNFMHSDSAALDLIHGIVATVVSALVFWLMEKDSFRAGISA